MGSAPRSGIIGTGFMSRVHAQSVLANGGIGIIAVAGLDELFALDLDVIHVCTPNGIFGQESPQTLWVGGRSKTASSVAIPVCRPARQAADPQFPPGTGRITRRASTILVQDVYDGVGGITSQPLRTFRDGLRAALVTDAIVESARAERWIEVPRTDTYLADRSPSLRMTSQ